MLAALLNTAVCEFFYHNIHKSVKQADTLVAKKLEPAQYTGTLVTLQHLDTRLLMFSITWQLCTLHTFCQCLEHVSHVLIIHTTPISNALYPFSIRKGYSHKKEIV